MELEVEIAAGRLLGRTSDGVARFLGVPYAAAPTGPLRFAPPRKPAPWPGVRNALEPGERLLDALQAGAGAEIDLPVSSIGYRCGYLNNASFTRAFVRHFGEVPTRLRARSLAA